MRELRFLYLSPHDFPDVPDCDGSCGGGAGGLCLLHAGLCCPDDSLDAVMAMENLRVFTDDLLEDLKLAKAASALHPRHGKEVFEVESDADVDAGNMDSGDRGAPRLPPPARAALSDSSWTTTTTSSIETTESSPPPPPPPLVSRLVVPRKKRDGSVKRGKRLWSLDIPNVPSSRDNPSGGGNGGDDDDSTLRDVDHRGGGGGSVRRRRLLGGAARPRSRQTQRACSHCESTETPQWRAGPNGPGTLCNACGIRYNMNKLLPEYRPSTSPSFQSDRHSNRHRKVVELRLNNNKVKERIIVDNTMPPAPDSGEFMDVCKYIAIIKGEESKREDDCQQHAIGARPW